jgi:hypothetical protein
VSEIERLERELYVERELYALAHEVAGWHDRESKSRMHAIFKRSITR